MIEAAACMWRSAAVTHAACIAGFTLNVDMKIRSISSRAGTDVCVWAAAPRPHTRGGGRPAASRPRSSLPPPPFPPPGPRRCDAQHHITLTFHGFPGRGGEQRAGLVCRRRTESGEKNTTRARVRRGIRTRDSSHRRPVRYHRATVRLVLDRLRAPI